MSTSLSNQYHKDLCGFIANVKRDLQSACANALKAGAIMQHILNNEGLSFGQISDTYGIPKSTVHRWISAHATACVRLGLEYAPHLSDPDFESHLVALDELAASTSINRLLIGAPSANNGDLSRLETLQTRSETATDDDIEIYSTAIEKVENGEWTLIQAMRAVSSQSVQDEATEKRKNPVYIDIDAKTGKPVGLLVQTISTIRTGFKNWEYFNEAAKREFIKLWKDTVAELPSDFNRY